MSLPNSLHVKPTMTGHPNVASILRTCRYSKSITSYANVVKDLYSDSDGDVHFRGLPLKKSPVPGPAKLPLLGVRAMERRNACLGVAGALAAAPATSEVLGVLRPLLFCIVTAVPGRESTVGTPFLGGGRNPSLEPSRKISSNI